MKKIIGILALLVLSQGSLSAGENANLKIEVSGLARAEGNLHIEIYDNASTWLSDQVVARQLVDIPRARAGQLVVTSITLPPGDYAISIFHDVNGNGELDSNFIGIPREPVGLSNNARAKFGPPKYKDAVFSLPEEGLTQRIAIKEI